MYLRQTFYTLIDLSLASCPKSNHVISMFFFNSYQDFFSISCDLFTHHYIRTDVRVCGNLVLIISIQRIRVRRIFDQKARHLQRDLHQSILSETTVSTQTKDAKSLKILRGGTEGDHVSETRAFSPRPPACSPPPSLQLRYAAVPRMPATAACADNTRKLRPV